MLAEFREQRKFIDKLPDLRMTFERFLQKGGHRDRDGRLERAETLRSKGSSFLLIVKTDRSSESILEADLIINISGPDGREVEEVLPSRTSVINRRNMRDYVDLPDRLKELKTVVDEFLQPHVRTSGGGIGSG